MTNVCQSCSQIDFESLFFNDFAEVAGITGALAAIEEEIRYQYREGGLEVVAVSTGIAFLADRNLGDDEELKTFHRYLDSVAYAGDRDLASLYMYFVKRLFAPLSVNKYACSIGTLSDLRQRAQSCQVCALLADTRVWRLPNACDRKGAEGQYRNPAVVGRDWECFLVPMWPVKKTMWRNSPGYPNELFVLPVPYRMEGLLPLLDAGFQSRTRTLSTIGLFDQSRTLWKSIPSIIDWSRVKEWFASLHEVSNNGFILGKPQSSSFLLMDVLENTITSFATLQTIKYAALSYVWGEAKVSEPWCSQIQRLIEHGTKSPVPFVPQDLPPTIQGALQVCKCIGIDYLWIDSLCVVQNNSEIMKQAVADMGHIYSGACLCIIAAADRDVHQALPGVNTKRALSHIQIKGITLGTTPRRPSESTQNSIWSTRGWTFQEALLARASLVILPDQIYLQSGRSLHCEAITVDVGSESFSETDYYVREPLTTLDLYEADIKSQDISDPRRTWLWVYGSIVSEYTGRKWTNPVDADNAFRGVSHVLSQIFHVEFEFGLPVKPLALSLGWGADHRYQRLPRRTDKEGHVLFPSYTWYSVVGVVRYATISKAEQAALVTNHESFTMPIPISTAMRIHYPATGFEKFFAIESCPQGTTASVSRTLKVLKGALPLQAKLYPIDLHALQQAINKQTAKFAQDQNRAEAFHPKSLAEVASTQGYEIDDPGDWPIGQLYLIPTCWRASPQPVDHNIPTPSLAQDSQQPGLQVAIALIVQVWIYPYMSPTSWPNPTQADSTSPSPPAPHPTTTPPNPPAHEPLTHILTQPDTDTHTFLARRVGIRPWTSPPLPIPGPGISNAPGIAKILLA